MTGIRHQTEAELRRLAIDIDAGQVWTDRDCSSPEDVTMTFMVLALASPQQIEAIAAKEPGLIYEYLDKAGSRSINGMPIFLSMNLLSKEDTEKVFGYMRELEQWRQKRDDDRHNGI